MQLNLLHLTAAKNAHEAVNNTLVARGYTPENTNGAMTDHGNTDMVYTWRLEETDTTTYSVSVSGGEITTKLSASDPNLYQGSDSTVTWLTRADWEGTFPKESAQLILTKALAKDLQNNHYDPSEIDMTLYPMPMTGADNGLRLYDMMGKSYGDPTWDLLLDQMSFDEMVDFIRDAFHGRSAIELALKIILVIVGIAFTLFGYFIFFKEKYSLINGFSSDYKAGRKNENYAKRVGIVEFIVGIVILIASVFLIILA